MSERIEHLVEVLMKHLPSRYWKEGEDIATILSESDKPVETGEYRVVECIEPGKCKSLGMFSLQYRDGDMWDHCILLNTSLVANFVCDLLNTLSKRIQGLEKERNSVSFGMAHWTGDKFANQMKEREIKVESLTAELKTVNERIIELENDNQMHGLVARDSNHEQTNSYNTIQSLMDENSGLKKQVGELEKINHSLEGDMHQVEGLGAYLHCHPELKSPEGKLIYKSAIAVIKSQFAENSKLKEREKITRVEIISQRERIKDLISDHYKLTQPLTAEVETQKAENERLRGEKHEDKKLLMLSYNLIRNAMSNCHRCNGTGKFDEPPKSCDVCSGRQMIVDELYQSFAPASPQGEETKEESDETEKC